MANSTHHASAIGMRTEVGHFFPGYRNSFYVYFYQDGGNKVADWV